MDQEPSSSGVYVCHRDIPAAENVQHELRAEYPAELVVYMRHIAMALKNDSFGSGKSMHDASAPKIREMVLPQQGVGIIP